MVSMRRNLLWLVLALVAVQSSSALEREGPKDDADTKVEFTDVRKQAEEFIGYYQTIQLTPEQEKIKRVALSNLPAPCCMDNSAYTCCCVCNLARTIWGLSAHLITERGFDADPLRAAVVDWVRFVAPDGYSGDACYRGGCTRSFDKNGCGGMDASRLIW